VTRKRRRPRPRVRPGTSPGTLAIHPEASRLLISAIGFGPEDFVERRISEPGEIRSLLGRWPVVWVNVDGVGDAAALQQIAAIFGLHRLALEDIANLGQRPKVEEYEEHLFVVLRMVAPEPHGHTEQLGLFVGDGYLLSFQEYAGDCFDAVRERIRSGKGRMRHSGPDYLAYALIDAVLDSYFPVIEGIGDRMEQVERQVFSSPERSVVTEIQEIKTELRELRRASWPHRDVTQALLREDVPRISAATRIYLRDCHDHAVQVTEVIDSQREVAGELMSTYLSSVNNQLSEVMKFLTIVASVFIPLGFIAAVYGMNFDRKASRWNMPELGLELGYPGVLLLMVLVAGGLLMFFRRKKWLR